MIASAEPTLAIRNAREPASIAFSEEITLPGRIMIPRRILDFQLECHNNGIIDFSIRDNMIF